MTVLRFRDRGWDVMTSSWTVATKKPDQDSVTLVYTWGGDGVGWSAQSVSTASITLGISFKRFEEAVKANPVFCDLTELGRI